jgi:chromosome segregation ATPase
VAELKATIEAESATMGSLDTKIEDLAGSIATSEADLKAATTIRDKEAADFAAEEKDLLETISTIERAIAILERELSKTAGASMLQLKGVASITQALNVMVQASVFSMADASRLTALVQSSNSDDAEDVGAPDPTVYENQSGGIIETLYSLLDKAKGQLDDARKTETESTYAFELLKQSLDDSIKFANKDMSNAKKELAEAGESKATAEGDLDVTSKALAADIESLKDLHHECMTKADVFEEETKSRGEELKALAEAKKVIVETTSGAEALTYDFNQQASASLLQIGSRTGLANYEVVRFVRNLAKKQSSQVLAQLAMRMASAIRFGSQGGDDPFAKVKGQTV